MPGYIHASHVGRLYSGTTLRTVTTVNDLGQQVEQEETVLTYMAPITAKTVRNLFCKAFEDGRFYTLGQAPMVPTYSYAECAGKSIAESTYRQHIYRVGFYMGQVLDHDVNRAYDPDVHVQIAKVSLSLHTGVIEVSMLA